MMYRSRIALFRGNILIGVRRIFTSVPLSAAAVPATASKSYIAHTIRVGRSGRDAWLAVDGIGNVTGRVVGSMTRLDVSPILYIGSLSLHSVSLFARISITKEQ